MFTRGNATQPEALLTPLGQRSPVCVYFLRVAGWSPALEEQLWRCHEAARNSGVVLDQGLPNPDNAQLTYYNEMLGSAFATDAGSIRTALTKWMPNLAEKQRVELADGISALLAEQKRAGKPDGALKSLYIKLMCWLYYRFRSMAERLGKEPLPLVLCVAQELSAHALTFLRLMGSLGADILLVEPKGDADYLKLDPGNQWSQLCDMPGLTAFPADWSIKKLRQTYASRVQPVPARPPQPAIPNPSQTAARPGMPNPSQAASRPGMPNPSQAAARPGMPNPSQAAARPGMPNPYQTAPRPGMPNPSQAAARPTPRTPPQPPVPPAPPPQPPVTPTPPPEPSKVTTREGKTLNIRGLGPKTTPPPSQHPDTAPAIPKMNVSGVDGIGVRTSVRRPEAPEARGTQPAQVHPEQTNLLLRFTEPQTQPCTNAWMENPDLDAVLVPTTRRGEDATYYYNCLIRLRGVPDKVSYASQLHTLYRKLLETGRRVLVVDETFPNPTTEELDRVRRHSGYKTATELIVDLANNLPASASVELQRLSQRAFALTLLEDDLKQNNLNKLLTDAAYLICWIRRYQAQLFGSWHDGDIPCCILMGHCRTDREALYLRYLALMPVDVLIFSPNLNLKCRFSAPELLELTGDESMPELAFPKETARMTMRTAASHAEEELTGMLFEGTGLYRNHQFSHANAVVLAGTQDEIGIYWKQDLNVRPNFSTSNGLVCMPVLWAKVSGVDTKDELSYWQRIAAMRGPDVVLFNRLPTMSQKDSRKYMVLAQKYLKNGHILQEPLTADNQYPFGPLRLEMQAHMLSKVQEMLDQRLIKGTFNNGTEYLVLSTALALPQEMQRMVHAFDFARRNPKIICVHNGDSEGTLEDAIYLTFLSLIGFDVVLYVPTGYQAFERHLNDRMPVEHQVGPYRFDMTVPDFDTLPAPKNNVFVEGLARIGIKIKRGN